VSSAAHQAVAVGTDAVKGVGCKLTRKCKQTYIQRDFDNLSLVSSRTHGKRFTRHFEIPSMEASFTSAGLKSELFGGPYSQGLESWPMGW